MPKRSIELTQG